MRILLALSKPEVRERVSFALESRYQDKPAESGTAREAIEKLGEKIAGKPNDIDLIVCEYPGISDVLFRHIVSLNRRRDPDKPIRVVVCCAQQPEGDQQLDGLSVLGFALWANLIDGVFKLLDPILLPEGPKSSPERTRDLTDEDCCQIKTTLLIRVGQLKADIYIRLSGTKYIKLFQEGDHFEEADYKRILKEKKLEHLHLRRDECSEFLIKFKEDLLVLLQTEIVSVASHPELLEAIHETVHELFNKLGATKEVQEVVKANVALTVKGMAKSPRLADVLTRFQLEKDKYISSHSTLLPQIACTLASGMEWKSDLTYQKLTLAAFLHDMSLTNHTLAAVTSLTELARRKDQFSEDEQKAYKNHPMRGAEFAKQMHEVPPDVDIIIMQHHERPDGTGFPRGLTQTHISPLSAVFIVAHDIVDMIYANDGKFVVEEFVASVKDRYQGANFKKLLKALSESKLGMSPA